MKHYLESVDLYLEIDKGLNITSDALNLSRFIKNELKNSNKIGDCIDIGSGIGTLSFLLFRQDKINKFYCVEIQKKVYEMLKKNILENKLEDKILAFNTDIKEFMVDEYKERFQYIVSNPPFYKVNSGKLPEDEYLKISKFEILLNLEDLFKISSYILKDDGNFFLILPYEREKEVLKNKYFDIINSEKILNNKKSFIMYNLKKKEK
ncbi:methyltransferase [Pseudostreptobacillus hongkongensis]|uniref:methyltransferase n=1 Tax=Pseudostreptobacillus hongkongensis TaxID=1162717 RepID=UPI000834DC99|nr:methyltransferase [Pseudostreptobacillus hongkongensis]